MTSDSFVSFINVQKSFGKNHVLNGLNLDIPRNKLSFIIGRSGDGKSVTLKHIVGVLNPDAGEIIIDNTPMHNADSDTWENVRKKIGILFQDGALFDSLTVFENVSFPLANHTKMSTSEMRNEVKYLLSLVGLDGFEEKIPPELSIGERKRVGLARALALKPKLLLYDEPTTSMDPLVSDLIDNLICDMQIKIEGITSVVVSHDITSVMNIAEYIFLLFQGKVYLQGTVNDFLASEDELVKQFLTGGREGPLSVPLV